MSEMLKTMAVVLSPFWAIAIGAFIVCFVRGIRAEIKERRGQRG